MRDDRPLRDAELEPGAGEPPAELDVLARHEGGVEAVLEQRVAADDGRDEPEPVLAAAVAMVLHQRLSPVARARLAELAGLERVVAVALELVDEVAQVAAGAARRRRRSARRSGCVAACAPISRAAGRPLPSSFSTCAAYLRAISTVRSVELPSTTMISAGPDSAIDARHSSSMSSAFRAGTTTVTGMRGARDHRRGPHRREGPYLRHAPDP